MHDQDGVNRRRFLQGTAAAAALTPLAATTADAAASRTPKNYARIPVEDPATGKAIAEIARAEPADVDRAVAAARACVRSCSARSSRLVVRTMPT